jgi:transketolase
MVGDVGYSVIEPFVEQFPKQYLNTGVSEQNMTGMAAGLAFEGYKVFTYSIANFNTIRCLEQIRNDICYHNLDVTVVSVGGGFVYGSAGYSHHAIQDIALLGSMPNMTLLLPADAAETSYCMDYVFKNSGPKYLRLGKNGEKLFHKEDSAVENINCFNPEEKTSIAIVSVGTILSTSFEIAEILKKSGVSLKIFSCPIIDSSFRKNIRKKLEKFQYIFTLEEHITELGFGALVKAAFEDDKVKVKSFGVDRDLCKMVGGQNFLREMHGLSPQDVASKIKNFIKK